jgi:acetyl esterase/lipase
VGKSADDDLAQAREQLAELRAALDVLALQPSVDPARIAYVGHDFGAMFGALLAGVDPRPRVFVLMAGVPTLSQWYLLGKTHPDRAAYVAALDGLDIRKSLAASHAKGFLFQFAGRDHYVKPQDATGFLEAAPLPRGQFTYDAEHDLETPQAHADRLAWLTEQLLGP